jgi:hypothetical protein
VNVISNLKIDEEENIIYDSFLYYLQLLNCFELPAVQLFAVWDIHRLCDKNREQILYEQYYSQYSNFFFIFSSKVLQNVNRYRWMSNN